MYIIPKNTGKKEWHKNMYCKHCGRLVDDDSTFCNNCGMRLDVKQALNDSDDSSNVGFAILGFFIPLVGLILFLVYESKQPERAKLVGKGALIGFITQIVLSIICVILYIVFVASVFRNLTSEMESNIPTIDSIFCEESSEEILEKYVTVKK